MNTGYMSTFPDAAFGVNNWMVDHYAVSEEDLHELGTDPHELTRVAGEASIRRRRFRFGHAEYMGSEGAREGG
jgi:hypothetical protein